MQQYDICKCGARVMSGFPCTKCDPPRIGSVINNSELGTPGGACNVTPTTTIEAPATQQTKEEQTAAALGLTVERMRQMQDYAAKLRKKHPQMKPDRLQRKVAEHFKVKLEGNAQK